MDLSHSADGSNKDGLREKRNLHLKRLRVLGIVFVVLAAILMGIGTAMLAVASVGQLGWPVFNVGPLILAVLMLAAGIVAFETHAQGQQCLESSETPPRVRNLLNAFNGLCSCCYGISSWASTFSFMAAANCASETSTYYKYCVPGKDANIALAAIGGSICIIFIILCAFAGNLYWKYACTFGVRGCCIKNC